MKTNLQSHGLVSAIFVATISASCGVLERPAETVEQSDAVERNASIYRRNCGACHGLDGTGNGVVASLMTRKPRDLTALTSDFGEFPRNWLIGVIDGRNATRAHGESDMPVWGADLQTLLGSDVGEAEVRAWIEAVVDHIETIQKTERPEGTR